MAKRLTKRREVINQPCKTCANCIHEHACQMWNIGVIHNADAANCLNHETVNESTAYFIGYRDAMKGAEHA